MENFPLLWGFGLALGLTNTAYGLKREKFK